MMNQEYKNALENLRDEIANGGARPIVIDQYLDVIVKYDNKNRTVDLFLLLSDDAEHDEGMFSIIHTAEIADDYNYVLDLLTVFPVIMNKAPRWASIVLMRTLNNEATKHELVNQLRTAPKPIKDAVNDMCERINSISPQFLSKTIPVTIAAKA